jgi:hypothetical protein
MSAYFSETQAMRDNFDDETQVTIVVATTTG